MADNKTMFSINGTDYSNRVVGADYEVQTNDEYNTWIDGNGREHRSAYRPRISGKFKMLFLSIEEYEAFIETLELNKKADLSYEIEIYDNKKCSTQEITAFIDFTPTRYRAPNWADMMEQIEVTIKET